MRSSSYGSITSKAIPAGLGAVIAIVVAGGATGALPPGAVPNDPLAHVRANEISGASPPPAPDAGTLRSLRDDALAFASLSREDDPTDGLVFRTTRQHANAAIGAGVVDSDQPVYLVVMRGTFVGGPGGGNPARVPRSEYLAVVVDAATGVVTDWGLIRAPQTATLGAPTPLDGAE